MGDLLQEFCDWRGVAVRVDRQAGIIRGVKVLGLESRNGRSYLPEALVQAAPLYEDAKVNVNHARGNPAAPRDYRDRIGTMRNVALRPGEGLFGDFHFNPKHALAEQLIWDAEHSPENVGFSHNVEARTVRQGDRVVVEAITRVQSVDLVADPATTRGLFESAAAGGLPAGEPPLGTQPLSLADVKRQYPELVEEIRQERAEEIRRLGQEVERLGAAEAAEKKRDAARRLLIEFQLPDPDAGDPSAKLISGGQFLELLLAAPSDQMMREMVAERAQLVEQLALGQTTAGRPSARPQCRDQHLVYAPAPLDSKSFAEAIT